ncbi:TIGR03086 family metal-binding protein [Modestobacter italicus]|uniref:TIGR03086 family metal-binding protein n=1 Tax=Modestobacter italicus (strain DSM 44449 / CECT 9708 / BC 501) TaxID=2732864 RepID=UPI001C94B6D3|nr:TIGR03086 family metal-binding protein [Modestobacter italicus]
MTTTIDLDLGPAADDLVRVVAAVRDDQLIDPTPCADTSVAALLAHVHGLAVGLRRVAEKQPPGGPPAGGADALPADWRTRIPQELDALVAAWRAPAAWEGVGEGAGVVLPAAVWARVVLDELVVHGWDVAAAVGAGYHPDPASVAECLAFVGDRTDAPADEAPGLFGPAVPVAADAPPLDRLLGATGRDPRWAPPVSG